MHYTNAFCEELEKYSPVYYSGRVLFACFILKLEVANRVEPEWRMAIGLLGKFGVVGVIGWSAKSGFVGLLATPVDSGLWGGNIVCCWIMRPLSGNPNLNVSTLMGTV